MAQRRRAASKATRAKAKAKTKTKTGRRPKRKAPAARRKAARPRAAAGSDRNAKRVAELEAENRRLREELERLRAEAGSRPPESPADLPPDEAPPTDF